jgi:hypothetical protein
MMGDDGKMYSWMVVMVLSYGGKKERWLTLWEAVGRTIFNNRFVLYSRIFSPCKIRPEFSWTSHEMGDTAQPIKIAKINIH